MKKWLWALKYTSAKFSIGCMVLPWCCLNQHQLPCLLLIRLIPNHSELYSKTTTFWIVSVVFWLDSSRHLLTCIVSSLKKANQRFFIFICNCFLKLKRSKVETIWFSSHITTEISLIFVSNLGSNLCKKFLCIAWHLRSVGFEMSFWCLQFLQKMNENKSTWGFIVVK